MFPQSYSKFYSVLGISLVLGLGAMSFIEGDTSNTGYFVLETASEVAFPWPVFLFGLFVGACAIGLVLFIFHHEHKRL